MISRISNQEVAAERRVRHATYDPEVYSCYAELSTGMFVPVGTIFLALTGESPLGIAVKFTVIY